MARSFIISAIALAKMPSLLPTLQEMDVPDDITDALLMFSGDEDATSRAESLSGIGRRHLIPFNDHYIRNVLLFEKASPLRMLGVKDVADEQKLRLHRKLLLQRLHPDKSDDQDTAIYTRRILEAWSRLGRGQSETPSKKAVRKAFVGPRIRWIRVPIERFSIFNFYRKTKA